MNQISAEILFDKFEIINCLKKDGETSVYIANHIYLGKKILLKTLNTEGLSDKTILERFKREAKILAQLDHPNLIKVLDFGTYKNFFYISFEYFESQNLREIINNNNLSNQDKKYLIIQLLKGLNAAHQNQIIHRDIKPENILVNSKLLLKIADFGLALVLNENHLTNSSSIVGTPSYMAPEQIRGERSQQTDLFSAGLVSYELYTKENPVLGADVGETINNILNFDVDKCKAKLDHLPEEIQLIIKNMLQINLDKRIKSSAEALKLLGVLDDDQIIILNSPLKKRMKNVLIISSLGLIIATAVVFFTFPKLFSNKQIENTKQPVSILQTSEKNSLQKIPTVENSQKVNENVDPKNEISSNKKLENLETKVKNENSSNIISGSVTIDSYPWARVAIDSNEVGITPIWNYILKPGIHSLKFTNAKYPSPVFEKIKIASGENKVVKLNFNNFIGYLKCYVNPYGNIYINDKLIGTTPMDSIMLSPGNYTLIIKNENYSPIRKEITITAGKTFTYKLNFKQFTQ